jgi:hypothetical protein
MSTSHRPGLAQETPSRGPGEPKGWPLAWGLLCCPLAKPSPWLPTQGWAMVTPARGPDGHPFDPLTAVEGLAPANPFGQGGGDGGFRMAGKQRTLPRGAPWDERALALARRLIPDLPQWLNPPTSEKHWMMLWASIGQELAEKEPEFAWGRGRKIGSKSRVQQAIVTPGAIRKRRSRGLIGGQLPSHHNGAKQC